MPSQEHNLLAHQALNWVGNRATGKGQRCGFEIEIVRNYIADAVSLCALQYRYAEYYKLIERRAIAIQIVPEVVCVFECKVSRADFISTFGNGPRHANRKTPIGSLHWCVTGKGVCEPEELPEFWGLLVQRGQGLSEVRPPVYNKISEKAGLKIAYELLWYGCAYRPWKSQLNDDRNV